MRLLGEFDEAARHASRCGRAGSAHGVRGERDAHARWRDRMADVSGNAARENDWAAACLLRARGRLNCEPELLRLAVGEWTRIGARFERAATLTLPAETLEAS